MYCLTVGTWDRLTLHFRQYARGVPFCTGVVAGNVLSSGMQISATDDPTVVVCDCH
jgi:hypothetical protein